MKDWDIQINYGIKTGCNEAFIINTKKRNEILANCQSEDERTRTAELIRPILRGRDIKRYGYEWADLWLIATFPARHYDIERFPAVKSYLLSFGMARLEQTGKTHIVNGEKIKARKKTANKWFEVQDSIAYWEDFNKPKAVWTPVNSEYRFTLLPPEFYFTNSLFMITGENIEYICAIFNSKLFVFYLNLLLCESYTYGSGTTFSNIKLIRINSDENVKISLIVNKLLENYNPDLNNELDELVYRLYNLSYEEIKFVRLR